MLCVNDLKIGVQNVQGWNDPKFRRYMLHQYRRRYKIFAALETWCPGTEEEREWAKDWKGSGGVFWASGPAKSANNPNGYKGRGVAIFYASELGDVQETGQVICRDPNGRFLAVKSTIHGRSTVVIAAHADNDTDEEQANFYDRLNESLPEYEPDTDYHFLLDANNVEDWDRDHRPGAGRAAGPQTRTHGLAAMRILLERHREVDNFRHIHPRVEEYTRNHTKGGVVLSQKRLDRIYSSAALHRSGSLPRVVNTEHVWPNQTDMAVLREAT